MNRQSLGIEVEGRHLIVDIVINNEGEEEKITVNNLMCIETLEFPAIPFCKDMLMEAIKIELAA